MKHMKSTCFALACFATAIGHVHAAESPSTDVSQAMRNETRTYVDSCISTKARFDPPALQSNPQHWSAAGIVAGVVIDLVKASISAAAKDESVTVAAPYPALTYFYSANYPENTLEPILIKEEKNLCLFVLSGSFGNGGIRPDDLDGESKWPKSAPSPSVLRSKLDPALIEPRLLFQAHLTGLKTPQRAFTLQPDFVAFSDPAATRFWDSGNRKRSVAIQVTLSHFGQPDNAAMGNFTFPFNDLEAGTTLNHTYFSKLATKPIAYPAISQTEKEEVEKSPRLTASKLMLSPITISVAVVEVRKASEMVKFLDSVANAAVVPIKTAVQGKLDGTTAKNEATASEQHAQDVADYYIKKATAESAYAAWQGAEPANKPEKWVKVLEARKGANEAARKVSMPEPYDITAGS